MTIEIRATRPEEMRRAAETAMAALLFPQPTDDEWITRAPSWLDADSFSAWEGERCVGHVAAYRVDTTVPGGARLATAAVTRVGVLPTHTRRGLLTTMMRELLGTTRRNGAVLASLRASEAVIYSRYGFGVAGEAVAARNPPPALRPLAAPAAGSMRILARDEVLPVVTALYDRCARSRTGTISRTPAMMRRYFEDAISGPKPSFVAVHSDESGTDDGYVHYTIAWDQPSPDALDMGKGEIHDLFGADAAVERALWAYVLGIDLIQLWLADERPLDDAVRLAGRDTRGYRVRDRWDEQWLRLLDVDRALSSRSYGRATADVTIAVEDPWFAENCGTWRIGSTGAERVAQRDAALRAPIEVVSAAYLGGTSWRELADAGRVEVFAGAAVAVADALFAQRPAPFCGSFF
jgi:predicted acetyltransferase